MLPWRRGRKKRTVVIGLDGTPFSFVREATANGQLPNFKELLSHGALSAMQSSHPFVSSVAWASFMTGKNPGKHGIFGFVDRRPNSYETFIPTGRDLEGSTLWDILSARGKSVCVLGVPMTYPPGPVNGVLVSGFLSPSLDKATHPPRLAAELKAMGYRLDTDPWAARQSIHDFLEDFRRTFSARARAILHLFGQERWDFFIAHIIDTDRLHHFMWSYYDDRNSEHHEQFLECYRQVDDFLGQLVARLDDSDELVLLSDHGSCGVRQEVFLNRWLEERGYLQLNGESNGGLTNLNGSSSAYSLDPGRIYVNLKGREPQGSVAPGEEYEELRDDLIRELLELKDPGDGQLMIDTVLRREEIYRGPMAERGPDLLAMPRMGYDMKGSLKSSSVTGRSSIVGMHTFDDAFLYVRGRKITRQPVTIMDVMPTILQFMKEPIPSDLDGVPCAT